MDRISSAFTSVPRRSLNLVTVVVVALVAALVLAATACSSSSPPTSGGSAALPVGATIANFRATGTSAFPTATAAVPTAMALWRALQVQGVRTTITGYDIKGTFSLATTETRDRLDAALDAVAKTPRTELYAFVEERPAGTCATAAGVASSAPSRRGSTPPGSAVLAGGVLPGFGTDRCFAVGPSFGTTAVTVLPGKGGKSEGGGTTIVRDDGKFVWTKIDTSRADVTKALTPCEDRTTACRTGRVAVVDEGQVVGVLGYDTPLFDGQWAPDPAHLWLTPTTPQLDVLRRRLAAKAVPPFEVVTAAPVPQPPPVGMGSDSATGIESGKAIRAGDTGSAVAKDVQGAEVPRELPNKALLQTIDTSYKIAAADFGPGLVLLQEMFVAGPDEMIQGLQSNPFADGDTAR